MWIIVYVSCGQDSSGFLDVFTGSLSGSLSHWYYVPSGHAVPDATKMKRGGKAWDPW